MLKPRGMIVVIRLVGFVGLLAFGFSELVQAAPGYALRFDGANSYLSAGNSGDFNSFPLSVSFWLRSTSRGATAEGIVSKYPDGGFNGWTLFMSEGRVRAWYIRSVFGFIFPGGQAMDSGFVADGLWHHIAFVVDASGGKLYVDGALKQSAGWVGTAGPVTTSEPLLIGRYANYATRFRGDLDEVTLWNRALGSNEVNYVKHRALAGTEQGLIALWHFDEGSGAQTTDATPVRRVANFAAAPSWIASTAPLVFNPVAGSALSFQGAGEGVEVTHNATLNAYPLTVMAWVRTTRNLTDYAAIFRKYFPGSFNGYSLHVYNGRLYAWYFRDALNYVYAGDPGFGGSFVADGQWHQVALVVDASGGRLYVDGSPAGSLGWTGTPGAPSRAENVFMGQYPNTSLIGALDEVSIWSETLSIAQINRYGHTALSGAEPGLVAAWRFNESSGNIVTDATGHNHNGTFLGNPGRTGSTAFLGDRTSTIYVGLGQIELGRAWAIQNSPATPDFPLRAPWVAKRLDDYGAPTNDTPVDLTLEWRLQSTAAGVVPLQSNQIAYGFTLPPFNAAAEPSGTAGAGESPWVPVAPRQPLDSVNDSFVFQAGITHRVNGGPVVTGDTSEIGPTNLLHFSGRLWFGTVEGRIEQLTNAPTVTGASRPTHLDVLFLLAPTGGYIAAQPMHRFGGGTPIIARLLVNGDAVYSGATPLTVQGPVPDDDYVANVRIRRQNIRLDSTGAKAFIRVNLPAGSGFTSSPTNGWLVSALELNNEPLDGNLRPTKTSYTWPLPTTVYLSEETKPLLIPFNSIEWRAGEGVFEFAPVGSELRFVRRDEDALLAAVRAQLMDTNSADRISNDGYYANATRANGPVIVAAGTNSGALLNLNVQLGAGELRPHFPYAGSSAGGDIPVTGGSLLIRDDLPDVLNSFLQVAGPVPLAYTRDCQDTNCSQVNTSRAVLEFSSEANTLLFTRDGGLVANGTVPPQNLTWGYAGGTNFAQRTSDVAAGAYHMPGTFLRGDQTALDGPLRPAVLLFTGAGRETDWRHTERPGEPGYAEGVANYAGINFRAPAQARSRVADVDTPWYPLRPRSKYYARYSGVSGLHEAAASPGELMLYGYPFSFATYLLSFLDSENWESRTDGQVVLPYPSDFTLDFKEMRFTCRGALERARLASSSSPVTLSYWNTPIQPLTLEFRPTLDDTCGTGTRYLTLGVQAQLPLVRQPLQALIAIKPNGNLANVNTRVAGVDSRFRPPPEIQLSGPGTSHYTLATVGEGYFNDWEAPGRPENGFYNVYGRLKVFFFEAVKAHVHVQPTSPTAGVVAVMGGWGSPDGHDEDRGWREGAQTPFNQEKFDPAHRGFPAVAGLTALQYRNYTASADYHPRARKEWLEVVRFDYPLRWDPLLRTFASFEDARVVLPVVDVGSRLKELTPGKADIDFAQDLVLKLPRIKALDFANDAVNEAYSPIHSVSNAIRRILGDAAAQIGLRDALRSLQHVLRDQADDFFRPILEPAFQPVVARLYAPLGDEFRTNAPGFKNVSNILASTSLGLKEAVRDINGVGSQVNTVAGQLNQVFTKVDETLELLLELLDKDEQGNRHIVREILQQLVEDQGPLLGIVADIGDTAANEILAQLEPALAKIEAKIQEVRQVFNDLQAQVGAANSELNQALTSITRTSGALDAYVQEAARSVSMWLASVNSPARDYFTANPAAATNALREQLMVAFLASPLPAKYQATFKQFFYEEDALLNVLLDTLFQQINQAIREGLSAQLAGASDNTFQGLKGPSNLSQNLLAARIRGSPTFNGDALKKIRLDAQIQMNLPDEMKFGAYLEVKELDSASTAVACIPPGAPAAEVTLGADNVPLNWTGLQLAQNVSIAARWTLQQGAVLGVGGSLQIGGDTEFKSVTVNGFSAMLAFGATENYFMARASGSSKGGPGVGFSVDVGIFAGKSCSAEPLKVADPNVGEVLADPAAFRGIYLHYGGVVPFTQLVNIPPSCVFRADGFNSTAFYYLGGPRLGTVGGRMKLGLDVELLCVLKGHLDYSVFLSASASELVFGGSANLCGSIGVCPFCLEGCIGVTIKGVVNDGGVDYFVDY